MANLTVSADIDAFMASANNAAARSNLSAAQSGANTDVTSVALTTGTVTNAPVSATDIVNKSYVDLVASGSSYSAVFNGSSSLQQATSFGLSVGDFTVEAFVNRLGDASVAHILCDQPNGFVLYSNGATVVFAQTAGANLVSGTLAVDSNWHHVAAVRESGTLSLYVDGTRVATTSDSTNFSTSGTAEIGALYNQAGYFTGQLADVRISSIARYSGTTLTVPTSIFVNDGSTLFLYLQGSTVDAGLTVNGSITFAAGPFEGKVASFSGGTTGLTPASATTGAVTLDGTLGIAHGGTGQTSASAALTALGGVVTANVQTFTSSGTWTKPAGAKSVKVQLLAGGGGGGSGRKDTTSATVRCGGGGGAGGSIINITVPAALFGATETVTIGAGGAGGAAQATDATNGSAGSNGGATSVGSFVIANGGTGGGGGTATTGTGGSGVLQGNGGSSANVSGAGGTTGVPSATTSTAQPGGASGASAGGITTANVASAGAAGGRSLIANLAGGLAGAAGAAGSAGNANSLASTGLCVTGSGGGSGGSSVAASGGAGGAGGFPAAGGGAGGACGFASGSSGAGGAGAAGVAVITTYF
jgi:hypothetical protein